MIVVDKRCILLSFLPLQEVRVKKKVDDAVEVSEKRGGGEGEREREREREGGSR